MSQKPKEHKLECPECGSPMRLQTSKYGLFYGCSRFPECKETHGAHPDGKPLGRPAKKDIRLLRREIHALAEHIWRWSVKKERSAMYVWLKKNTKSGHIGEMEKSELMALKEKLLKMIYERN